MKPMLDSPATASGSALAPARILIVDDVPQNLIALEALLLREDVHVLKASSGAQALELLLEHEVALALLDVNMPEMDGFTLAELMRGAQRTRHVPIIFLTASADDPARSFKGYESGAVDFLHKPIDARILSGKVEVFIELYRQRQQLRQHNERLEQTLQLNETMIAVLSHDLRTPLSSITICAERIKQELEPTSPLQRTADHVENSARRMARMVDQLLEFSRIRTHTLTLKRERLDLAELARTVVEEIRTAFPGREVSLSMQGEFSAHIDAVRMSQVLTNLAGNALQYAPPGSAVQLELDGRDPRQLGISVCNAGQIPDTVLPRLFEPFKGGFHYSQGLGLGLYIVNQFVLAHGGQVTAENRDDSVCFTVTLPRQ